MKTLTFKDQTTINLLDASTPETFVAEFDNYAAIDTERLRFTEENLDGATLDSEELHDIIPVSVSAFDGEEGKVIAHFVNRIKSDVEKLQEEIAALKDSQSTQDAAIEDLGQAVSDLSESEA